MFLYVIKQIEILMIEKKMKKFKRQTQLILAVLFMNFYFVTAQTNYVISGKLIDENNNPVVFANVTLLSCQDSSIVAGTISGNLGQFTLKYNNQGHYVLSASSLGYLPAKVNVKLFEKQQIEYCSIVMVAHHHVLDEVVVVEDRLKAKQQVDKTAYYVNKTMLTTSNTGVDLIKKIPGIQVDLMQNVSLNGSQNIIIMVNGIERDASYIAQLDPSVIDRIEVNEAAGAEYDAETSGTINVVLKKNEKIGMSGHINAAVPTSNKEVFSFPTAGLSYTNGNLTLFSSYEGAFSYFDIEAIDNRLILLNDNSGRVSKVETLFQENWSHKWHIGMDYVINENNQFNVYGSLRRFSNEQSGDFSLNRTGDSISNQFMHYRKIDNDINTSAYSSIFFKHIFNKATYLRFNANYYMLRSKNSLSLIDQNNNDDLYSRSQPYFGTLESRLSLHSRINRFFGLDGGIECNLSRSGDKLVSDFSYDEIITAGYLSANVLNNNYQTNIGLRTELWYYLSENTNKNHFIILPTIQFKYDFSNAKNFRFTFAQDIVRPSVFQLNSNLQYLDFYSVQRGNPDLKPTKNYKVDMDYSISFGNSFVKTGVFYRFRENVVEYLSTANKEAIIEQELHNLGNIQNCGISASGSIKIHKNIIVNPHFRIFHSRTNPNEMAQFRHIEEKQTFNLESSLSAMYLMKRDFAFSFSIQYKSQKTNIQHDYYEDPLYFITLEKRFFKHLKIGITAANPFGGDFTYTGNYSEGEGFERSRSDDIQLSVFPVWFNLKYNFSSGKKVERIKRNSPIKEILPKKGF
jgi:hypothetical protein